MKIETRWDGERGLATISLSRPEALNALDYEMLEAIGRAFQEADARGARAIRLRGDGRSFCAGADRRHYPGYGPRETDVASMQHAINVGARVTRAIGETNAVTIAEVQGHAIGGGLVLAMACDMRFVAEDAKLSLPELRLGLPLGWGGFYRLVALVGMTRAWSLLTRSEPLSGIEAVDWGLCNEAAPADMLGEKVAGQIERLLDIAPEALVLTKRQFRAIGSSFSRGDLSHFDGPLLLGPLRAGALENDFSIRK